MVSVLSLWSSMLWPLPLECPHVSTSSLLPGLRGLQLQVLWWNKSFSCHLLSKWSPSKHSQDKNWLRSDISPQSAQECQNTWTWSVPPTHLVSPAHNTHLQHTAKTSGSSSKKNVLFLQMLCTFTPTCFCPCYLPDMQCLFPLFYLLHSGHPLRLFNIPSSDHVAEKKEQNGSWARSPALSPALPFPGGIWAHFSTFWFRNLDWVTWLLFGIVSPSLFISQGPSIQHPKHFASPFLWN